MEQPKIEQTAKLAPPPPKFVAPPPAASQANIAPPPAVIGPGLSFDQDSITSDDPVIFYKQQVEAALRSKWNRPSDVPDLGLVAEVEMRIDPKGKITGYEWKKRSGNEKWDNSVKATLAGVLNRPPPKDFPEKFLVRFDVQPATEPLISRAD